MWADLFAATTPTPVTSAVDPVAAGAAVAIIVASAFGLTVALLRAARYPHPTSMVTALSLLTLISLIGLSLSDGEVATTFGTISATGMGALAGAVTSTFGRNNNDGKKEDPTKEGDE